MNSNFCTDDEEDGGGRCRRGRQRDDGDGEVVVAMTTRTGAEDGSDQKTVPNAALIPI